MGEAAWPAEPVQGQKARPPQALAQCGGIIVKDASGCSNVVPATR